MSSVTLDELDHKIIEAFGQDGRASNRQIALDLNVTEGTIRTRIKRLQSRHLIHFTAITSYRFAGSPNLVMLGIRADQSRVQELAGLLALIPEIGCVVVLLGRYNLLAMGLFTSLEQVDSLINSRIRVLPGVKQVETSIAIHNVKYRSALARITNGDKADSDAVVDEVSADIEE
jgi:Lrp/AsnC family transcriptional regulator for asnA, asnC and gidA